MIVDKGLYTWLYKLYINTAQYLGIITAITIPSFMKLGALAPRRALMQTTRTTTVLE